MFNYIIGCMSIYRKFKYIKGLKINIFEIKMPCLETPFNDEIITSGFIKVIGLKGLDGSEFLAITILSSNNIWYSIAMDKTHIDEFSKGDHVTVKGKLVVNVVAKSGNEKTYLSIEAEHIWKIKPAEAGRKKVKIGKPSEEHELFSVSRKSKQKSK